jgi:cell division protein FtsQ
VADVEVVRRWPSTLVLSLEERISVAWLRGPDGSGAVIAADGVVLAAAASPPPGLPSVGAIQGSAVPGARLDSPQPALRVAASFPPALRRLVAAVRVGEGGVTLRLRTGGTALYGSPSSLTAKNTALLSLLRQADRDRMAIEYVDVTVPSAPAVKPAEKAPSTG